jgi:NAD(P)-dependent dehydrogenase (short-subunit alcohol dehydrogenase family)
MALNTASRKVMVTGGSSGSGRSIITKFYGTGFETITADINAPENLPGRFFQVDLTSPSQIDTFTGDVKDAIGNSNILIM